MKCLYIDSSNRLAKNRYSTFTNPTTLTLRLSLYRKSRYFFEIFFEIFEKIPTSRWKTREVVFFDWIISKNLDGYDEISQKNLGVNRALIINNIFFILEEITHYGRSLQSVAPACIRYALKRTLKYAQTLKFSLCR